MRPVEERERFAAIALMAASLTAVAALFWAPPSTYRIPPCPSLFLTGLFCPGCGSLRAAHHLLRGHLLRALGFNPLFVLVLPYLGLWWLGEAWVALRGRRWQIPMSPKVGGLLVALVCAFWVARNLPFAACNVLRPVAENPLLVATAEASGRRPSETRAVSPLAPAAPAESRRPEPE